MQEKYVIVVAKVPDSYPKNFVGQYVSFSGALTTDIYEAKIYNSRQDATNDCEKWEKCGYGEGYDVVDYNKCIY